MKSSNKAVKIAVMGRVQGVGFRPFIFSIADKFDIKGTVQNNMDGVRIFAEGTRENIDAFVDMITYNPPRIARIDEIRVEAIPLSDYPSFSIVDSDRSGKSSLVIPVDTAVCPECLAEMEDPTNFRFQYPFTNCTQCGPRYTIIEQLPYDRPFTTMDGFQMCSQCETEYNDPLNRRHHAQPIACPQCGPQVSLKSMDGEMIDEGLLAIDKTKKLLVEGKIVAIKGLGGYHLACNGLDHDSVERLRKRKNRPKRPLAMMAATISIVEKTAFVSEKEKQLLLSPEAPIVVLKKRKKSGVPTSIAPGMTTIGMLLPYTPLHKLLCTEKELPFLVMTSANPSGLPLLYKDEEAFQYLNGIADFVLSSNREIAHPIDDSVVQVVNGNLQFFRRARGYVPDPIVTKRNVDQIVALGPQQKNTFAIGRNEQIFIGPHIGDMGSQEVTEHFLNEYQHLQKWMGVKPMVISVDMHPTYETTKLAKEMDCEKIIQVQHHHAHHVACMEEHQLTEKCFGIILDGTGYGPDGNIWGFELLFADATAFHRLAHLAYTPLPGGDKAVKEPWRNAVGLVLSHFGMELGKEISKQLFPTRERDIDMMAMMVNKQINSPLAGTCGRLFDAVSAIVGVCSVSTYDGEAAILLSEMVDEQDWTNEYYLFELIEVNGVLEICTKKMIAAILHDKENGLSQKTIVLKFHESIVQMCAAMLLEAVKKNPNNNRKVVLSGGSFHNRYILTKLVKLLEKEDFQVFTHKNTPCNDGGIALGQLIVASEILSRERGN